jgi:hypothetical protein
MKAFLLFLLLGGAALYTFLVVTHDALQDGKTENTLALQTQPNQPVAQQLSSWGSHLSSSSLSLIESPSLTQAAMESTTTEPLPAKPVVQKPKKQIRSAKSGVRVVAQSDPWSGRMPLRGPTAGHVICRARTARAAPS